MDTSEYEVNEGYGRCLGCGEYQNVEHFDDEFIDDYVVSIYKCTDCKILFEFINFHDDYHYMSDDDEHAIWYYCRVLEELE